MCGRFYIPDASEWVEMKQPMQQLKERYLGTGAWSEFHTGEIFPGQTAPVYAPGKSGRPGLYLMRWGFTASTGRGLVINARSETALTRPMFAQSMALRRCLIPAGHYFEWMKQGGVRVKFSLRSQSDGPIWMAGLYRLESPEALPSFVVLTQQAAPEISFIHERMPVLLTGENHRAWLDQRTDAAAVMLSGRDKMRFEAVG